MLTSGIPLMSEYVQLLESHDFREMECYSDEFLKRHDSVVAPYRWKWVGDPLHQWSRQWEYPYVYRQIQAADEAGSRAAASVNVLDAGSGFTFFPYFLQSRVNELRVSCFDYDASLGAVFQSVNAASHNVVDFVAGRLSSLPFKDREFQIVYCVSVLEHTQDYPAIIQEFHRVLDKNGTLIVTFDISIDGDRDVAPRQAAALIRELGNVFTAAPSGAIDVETALRDPEILTTLQTARRDKRLLPWKNPLIPVVSTLRKGRFPKRWGYPNLTCWCGVFRKHPA